MAFRRDIKIAGGKKKYENRVEEERRPLNQQ